MLSLILAIALTAPPESSFTARVDALRDLQLAGRKTEANTESNQLLQELTAAAREKPRDVTILVQLGRTQLYGDDVGGAVKSLDAALKLAPRDVSALVYRGSAAMKLGEYVEARELFTKATELAPNDARGWAGLGRTLVDGKPGEGVTALRKAVTLNPKDSSSLALLGHTLFLARRFADGSEFLEKALALQPDDAFLTELAGDAAQAAGKYPLALAHFEQLAKAESKNWTVRTKLVQVNQAMGDFAARDRWRAEVVALAPRKAFCRDLFMLGGKQVAAFEAPDSGSFEFRIYTPQKFEPERGLLLNAPGSERDGGPSEWTFDDTSTGRLGSFAVAPSWDELRALVTFVLTAPPQQNAFAVRLELLRLQPKSADGQKLVDELTAAVNAKPKDVTLLTQLGCALTYSQIDPPGAMEPLDKALAIAPQDVQANLCRGMAAEETGGADLGVKSFTKVTALAPKDPRGWAGLGRALHEREQWPGAVAALQKAVALDPQDASSLGRLGESLIKLKRAEEGVANLEKAISLRPSAWRLRELAGDHEQALGKYALALVHFELAAKARPNDVLLAAKVLQASQAVGDLKTRDTWVEAVRKLTRERFCRDRLAFGDKEVVGFETPTAAELYTFALFKPPSLEPERGVVLTVASGRWSIVEYGVADKSRKVHAEFDRQPSYDEVRKVALEVLTPKK